MQYTGLEEHIVEPSCCSKGISRDFAIHTALGQSTDLHQQNCTVKSRCARHQQAIAAEFLADRKLLHCFAWTFHVVRSNFQRLTCKCQEEPITDLYQQRASRGLCLVRTHHVANFHQQNLLASKGCQAGLNSRARHRAATGLPFCTGPGRLQLAVATAFAGAAIAPGSGKSLSCLVPSLQ